jgi:hypothetical protein
MDGEDDWACLRESENDCAAVRICGCEGMQITNMILAFEFSEDFEFAKMSRFWMFVICPCPYMS